MIRTVDGMEPDIADSAYVDPAATVVGDVTIEADASVWPGAVLRGDTGAIRLREGTNVQDNATVHEDADVGPHATVGHNAIVHAATVRERAMVGMGAIVLDDVTVGARSLVAANGLVTEGTDVPESVIVAGTPAQVVKEVTEERWHETADRYVEKARAHAATSDVVADGHVPDGDD